VGNFCDKTEYIWDDDDNDIEVKHRAKTQTFQYGQNKALSKNNFEREGYSFIGWQKAKPEALEDPLGYEMENEQGTVNFTDRQVASPSSGEDITLYAVWMPNNLEIIYKYVNKQGQEKNVTQSLTMGSTFDPIDISDVNDFDFWSTVSNMNTLTSKNINELEIYFAGGGETIPKKSLVLHAQSLALEGQMETYRNNDSNQYESELKWLIIEWATRNEQDPGVRLEEKMLIYKYPIDAIKVNNCRKKADKATEKLDFKKISDGRKSNAFKHAYWNALMVDKVGNKKAKLFADAHEAWSPVEMKKIGAGGFTYQEHTEMDLYNNKIGRMIGRKYTSAYKEKKAGVGILGKDFKVNRRKKNKDLSKIILWTVKHGQTYYLRPKVFIPEEGVIICKCKKNKAYPWDK
jgi:hypothetical protein